MKRLLRLCFDTIMFSAFPILGYYVLGYLVNPKLTNIFTVTYALQFVYAIIICIFGEAVCIYCNKDVEKTKRDSVQVTGIYTGMIISCLFFGIMFIYVDKYLELLGFDIEDYRVFARYSIVQLCSQSILHLLVSAYQYQNELVLSNKISFYYNILNFILITVLSLITKNEIYIALLTSLVMSFYIIYLSYSFYKVHKTFRPTRGFLKGIKYEGFKILKYAIMLCIYLMYTHKVNNFGNEYFLAYTFACLVTDLQWDCIDNVPRLLTIDISQGKTDTFNKCVRCGYILFLILLSSIIIMSSVLRLLIPFNKIVIYHLILEIGGFILFPIYSIMRSYLVLNEYSSSILLHTLIATFFIRFGLTTVVPSPYANSIGLVCSSLYQVIVFVILFKQCKSKQREKLLICLS